MPSVEETIAFLAEERATVHFLGAMPARGGNPEIGAMAIVLLRDGRSARGATLTEAVAGLVGGGGDAKRP